MRAVRPLCLGLLVGLTGSGALSGCEPWQPAQRQAVSPLRRVRRLSRREYDHVVHDLLGDTSGPAQAFIEDVYPNGYDNGSAGLAVQSDQVVAYQAAAETLAETAVTKELPRLLGGCYVQIDGAAACLESFLNGFAARAYRRPLTPTEADRLRTLVLAEESQPGGDFVAGIQVALEVVLQSPQFLYREELGAPGAPQVGSAVALSDYEVASELSFLITGSIPDDELWTAIDQGRFRTVSDRRREAARLFATPAARAALHAFLHEWLTTNRLATLTKDKRYYPTFTSDLAASMSTELDGFFDQVFADGRGSLRELFTSERSTVDARLAGLYGVSPPANGFAPVSLDARTRKGVLTRAGYLAVHADVDSSGPVARGVFVLDAILCAPPPAPPANVPPPKAPDDPTAKNLTTRQRFAEHARDPLCLGCHRQIDGVGFGFEQFDSIGAFRAFESGQPVDSSGELYGTHDDGPFDGASALALRLARSPDVAACFARQAYRWGMGEIEFSDDSIAWVRAGFTTDSPLITPLYTLIESPAFATRLYEGLAP